MSARRGDRRAANADAGRGRDRGTKAKLTKVNAHFIFESIIARIGNLSIPLLCGFICVLVDIDPIPPNLSL